MSILQKSLSLPEGHIANTSDKELGVTAKWWTSDSLPKSVEDVDLDGFFEVNNVEDRGEHFKRPEGATGIVVASTKKLTVLAGWRNDEHKGPWQIYSEQEKGTLAFHYVGDVEVVFVGWV